MVQDFPAKLRVTGLLLDCNTGKELGARFRAVNPHTAFDVERARKWVQGRALPRQAQVYEDWAKLLRSERGGAWLAACTLEAFVAEVAERFGKEPDALLRQVRTGNGQGGDGVASSFGLEELLTGTFAAYSHAWSPYHRGQLIRGCLVVTAEPGQALRAVYSEQFTGRPVRWSGPVQVARGALNLDLREPGSALALFVCVFQPRPPGCAMVGTMSGASFIGPEPRPSTTRIVLVRAPEADQGLLERSNGYVELGEIATDLRRMGFIGASIDQAATLVARCLVASWPGGLDQVPATEQGEVAAAFDALHLQTVTAHAPEIDASRNAGQPSAPPTGL